MVPFSFAPLASGPCESWLWGKQYHLLDTNSKHIQPSREPHLSPVRYCHLVHAIPELLKGQGRCFKMVDNMVRPVNSMSMDPWWFFCFLFFSFAVKRVPWLKNNVVWNTMMIDKAFYKSIDGSFGRSTVPRDHKSVSRVSISVRLKHCLFHNGKSPV